MQQSSNLHQLPLPKQNNAEDFEKRFAREVGVRLRRVRQTKRLSLADVAVVSGGEVGAAALGAYERGGRVISAPRLGYLASLYGVPLEVLLPDDEYKSPPPEQSGKQKLSARINLTRLRVTKTPEAVSIRNFIELVRVERHDYEGQVFTLRHEDLRILGASFALTRLQMLQLLDDLGLLIRPRN